MNVTNPWVAKGLDAVKSTQPAWGLWGIYSTVCYNEREGILFIMESSIIVFTRERLFMQFMHIRLFILFMRKSLFIVFTKERLFMLFKFICTVYTSKIN